jgi:hypothetical protein
MSSPLSPQISAHDLFVIDQLYSHSIYSSLSPQIRAHCLSVMDQLCSRSIAQPFLSPTSALHLPRISDNLRSDKYSTISEWKSDVDHFFTTAIQTHQQSPLVLVIARDLQKQFHDLTKNLTDSADQTWRSNLIQMHQELTVAIRELIKARTAPHQKAQRAAVKRDQLYPILEELPPAHLRRHFKSFTKEELSQMTTDLTSIKEDSQLALIASLVKKNEPNLKDDPDPLEIDINLLRPSTLKLIREHLDQLLRV